MSKEFYESIPYEHLLIVEMDSYLRKPLDESMFQYDYVASPYEWDKESAGGGISYRKKSVMLDICKNYKSNTLMQDCFVLEGIKMLGYKMPKFLIGMKYFCESTFYDDPIGVHQWWTFFEKKYTEYVFHKYLELELLKG